MSNRISGFTTARNAVALGYPLEACVESLVAVADEVVVNYDPYTDDGTDEVCKQLRNRFNVRLFESKWDMDNRKEGTEIGIQAQKTLEACSHDWTLYCQLDEAFHEDDREALHTLVASPDVSGFSFVRPYFWKNLHTIRKDWSPEVIRLTRKGTHTFATLDGHNSITLTGRVAKSGLWMYHYSRLGDAQLISQRIRAIGGLFHADETLLNPNELPDYDWGTRQWDNFSKVEAPPLAQAEFASYYGTHPCPFAELYKDHL